MSGVTLVIFALVQSPRWGWADARTGECLRAAWCSSPSCSGDRHACPTRCSTAGCSATATLDSRIALGVVRHRLLRNLTRTCLVPHASVGLQRRACRLVDHTGRGDGHGALPVAGSVADRFGHRVLTVLPASPGAPVRCGYWSARRVARHRRVWLPAMVLSASGRGSAGRRSTASRCWAFASEFSSRWLRIKRCCGCRARRSRHRDHVDLCNTGASALTPFAGCSCSWPSARVPRRHRLIRPHRTQTSPVRLTHPTQPHLHPALPTDCSGSRTWTQTTFDCQYGLFEGRSSRFGKRLTTARGVVLLARAPRRY